jgi:hypothetical protein
VIRPGKAWGAVPLDESRPFDRVDDRLDPPAVAGVAGDIRACGGAYRSAKDDHPSALSDVDDSKRMRA